MSAQALAAILGVLRDSLGRRPTDDEFHEHMRGLGWSRRIVEGGDQ